MRLVPGVTRTAPAQVVAGSVAVQIVVAPWVTVTVPDGVPEPGDTGATATVKVPDWP